MRQIRKGVFETNSSSTHSICINKAPVKIPKDAIVCFCAGEWGWENSKETDTADYLYTGILDSGKSDEWLDRLKVMLDEMGVQYKFKSPREHQWYGIDHGYNLEPFIEAVLSDKDLLARYLFGDSFIYTGNDNQDPQPSRCDIARETYWDEDDDGEYKKLQNPYHDSEHYDYFRKGN